MNATQAAIRAGYSPRTANRHASYLLAHPVVQSTIQATIDSRSARVQLRADDVLREVRRIAFSDVRKLYREDGTLKSPSEWDDETAAAVSSVQVEESGRGRDRVGVTRQVRLWDKAKALGQAIDHLGLSNRLTLETILATLPPAVAEQLRSALGQVARGA